MIFVTEGLNLAEGKHASYMPVTMPGTGVQRCGIGVQGTKG